MRERKIKRVGIFSPAGNYCKEIAFGGWVLKEPLGRTGGRGNMGVAEGVAEGFGGRLEEDGEEFSAFAEDAAEDFGDGEDELAVRDFVADGGGDPVAGGADAALVARGAEVATLAGEGEKEFVAAVGALESGEAGSEVTATEEGLDGGVGGGVERAESLRCLLS